MTSLFTSPQARQQLLEWYERFHARIVHPTERRVVQTRFGEAHALVGGPQDGAAVVLLHGALASPAHLVGELQPLLERFRVYAVDVVGQSAKSADHQPSVKNDEYGHWLADVLDALSLPAARIVGVSWGAFVALRFAAIAPQRVDAWASSCLRAS
jgi:pimeloyl-ACP methyl ester carboxylesterase